MLVMLPTIWCAEAVSDPKRETKTAMKVKLDTSKNVLKPIGIPTWRCSFKSDHLGPVNFGACICL